MTTEEKNKMKEIQKYPKYFATEDGQIFSSINNRNLTISIDTNGYARVGIYSSIIKKSTAVKVHRIIAETLIPNPENKKCVNHKNGIKSDNRIENLEWATHSENTQHAWDTGLKIFANHLKGEYRDRIIKYGIAQYKCKKVINLKTGQIYESVSIAADRNNIKRSTLTMMLKNINTNKTDLRYA